jgi:hypothetical protein
VDGGEDDRNGQSVLLRTWLFTQISHNSDATSPLRLFPLLSLLRCRHGAMRRFLKIAVSKSFNGRPSSSVASQ